MHFYIKLLRPSLCLCVCSVLRACFPFSFPSLSSPSVIGCRLHSPRHRCTSAPPSPSRIGCRRRFRQTAYAPHSTYHLFVRPHLNPVLCTLRGSLALCVFLVGVLCVICPYYETRVKCSVLYIRCFPPVCSQLSLVLCIVLFFIFIIICSVAYSGTGPMGIHVANLCYTH